ncbi:hypothetical protein [Kitasatospora sp. NPDC093558]|uniref:hypothetical protein n=1 Tax=Kitasatospora sp. NPDC093558 TaxID=3155201 RepID=UPI003441B398
MTNGLRFSARSGPPESAPHSSPAAAVDAVLTAAFAELPEPARARAPLYVQCGEYTGFAARRYVGRCHDTTRRLRPSDSTALEPAELVRRWTTAAGHRGPCFLLAGPDWRTLRERIAGPQAGVHLDITLLDENLPVPGCLVTATVRQPQHASPEVDG